MAFFLLDRAEPRIDGPRIYLRPPLKRDWHNWAELRGQSRDFLVPWEPSWASDALTRAAFRRRLDRQSDEWERDTAYSFFILRQSDDALLGGINLNNVRRGIAQMASLGYWIGRPYARSGYMTEAVRCAIAYGFDQVGLHRLEAACLPSNAASQAVLKRCGFQAEGLARRYLRINGEWQDHLLFGYLRDDTYLREEA